MPRFVLHAVGDLPPTHFWREYTLEGEGVKCCIREVMLRSMFELAPAPLSPPCLTPPKPRLRWW